MMVLFLLLGGDPTEVMVLFLLLGGDPTKENTLGHKAVDYCRTAEMKEMIEESAQKVSLLATVARRT